MTDPRGFALLSLNEAQDVADRSLTLTLVVEDWGDVAEAFRDALADRAGSEPRLVSEPGAWPACLEVTAEGRDISIVVTPGVLEGQKTYAFTTMDFGSGRVPGAARDESPDDIDDGSAGDEALETGAAFDTATARPNGLPAANADLALDYVLSIARDLGPEMDGARRRFRADGLREVSATLFVDDGDTGEIELVGGGRRTILTLRLDLAEGYAPVTALRAAAGRAQVRAAGPGLEEPGAPVFLDFGAWTAMTLVLPAETASERSIAYALFCERGAAGAA